MIRALIFDVDGVLLDNTGIIVKGYQEAARRLGIRIPDEKEIKAFCGLPRKEIISNLLGKDKRCTETYVNVYHEYEKEMKPMEGVEILKEISLPKAIVTSKPRHRVERQIKNLLPYFDVIVTTDDTKKHKPDPEPLLLACRKLGIKPEETVYIGDALRDFETAKNAGTDFIGMLSGVTRREEFEKAGCNKIISSLRELPGLIKN